MADEKVQAFKIRILGGEESIVTLNKLKAANRELRKEVGDVNIASAEGQKKRDQINKQIENNTKIIKANSDAIVKQKMNIGNYQSALQGLPGPLKNVVSGVQGLGKAFMAIISSPILLVITGVVAALASLYKAFKSTDQGATELDSRMKQLKVSWSVYLQSLLDFNQGSAETVAHFKEATKAAREYIYAMDALQDRIIANSSETARWEAELAELTLAGQDQTLSVDMRISKLEEAMAIEKKLTERRKVDAKEEYKETVKQVAAQFRIKEKTLRMMVLVNDEVLQGMMKTDKNVANARNRMNDDIFKNLKDLYNKEFNIDEESAKSKKRLVSRLSGLYQEDMRNEKAAIEKINKFKKEIKEKEFEEYISYIKSQKEVDDEQWNYAVEQALLQQKQLEEINKNDIKNKEQSAEEIKKIEKDMTDTIKMEEDERQRKRKESFEIEQDIMWRKADVYASFAERTGEMLGDFMMSEEASLKEFSKQLLIATLEGIRLAIFEARVKILAQAMSSRESLATFGVAGLAKYAIINGLLSAAFAAAKAGINKMEAGGRIQSGNELPGSRPNTDNTLILAKPGEVVLNERQQLSLGGPEMFRRIGVKGFAEGGLIGSGAMPSIASGNTDIDAMIRGLSKVINQQKVILNLNELEEKQSQLTIIKSTSGI